MTVDLAKARELFLTAAEKGGGPEQAAYLDAECGGNRELRSHVDMLLGAHEQSGSFLDDGVFASRTVDFQLAESAGTVIGPYKLLQQIGEGGMGVVFMAEQTAPIQRNVALKIIKPGMDTRQVIARFEAERQALALMDHPNIAKVLDAGATASGRPFFAMELVKGVPITTYCDEKHLPLRDRLELFIAVCQAVQHAHQKGIIHRDLKPNNVLVAEYDNQAVPKVIDFGVAKATAQKLTERTMFTEFGQVVGTLEYMSPEQAKLNQLDIDTRSDVYSLGVLLYELLAGSTPFEGKRLQEAALDEMLRIIREEDPPKPSTRVSSNDTLPSVAANRHTEPARLSKAVRGELDWIVMKALEKDRNRRYETASGFAADIERHLHDEPVEAGPPSAAYRFRKFARRNKAALGIAAMLVFLLAVLGGGAGWAVRDRSARQAHVTGQLELILDEVARLEAAEKWSEALAAARRAEPALAAGEAPAEIQGRVRQSLADLELVRQLDDNRAKSGAAWGEFPSHTSFTDQADREYRTAFQQADLDVDALPLKALLEKFTARRSIAAALLPALDDWIAVRTTLKDEDGSRRLIELLNAADPDPWRQQMREALARQDWQALDDFVKSAGLERQPAATLTFLARALGAAGKHVEQDFVLMRAQWKYPADYWINHRLGIDLIWRQSPNDIRDGIGFMRAAVALRPQSGHSIMNLGIGLKYLGQLDQAIACYRMAIELQPRIFEHYSNLGIALGEKGLHDEAIAAFEHAMKLAPEQGSVFNNLAWLMANTVDANDRTPDTAVQMAQRALRASPNNGAFWTTLGAAQFRAGDLRAAIDSLKKAEELPNGRSTTCLNALILAMTHWQLGEQDEARQWYGKAVEWMEKQQTDDDQLRRFRAEAAELLKVTDSTPMANPPVESK